MEQVGFRIPDRAFAILAGLVLALIWGLLIWAWPLLPEQIPTHFGPSGAADAWSPKGFWSVFLAGVVPTLMAAGFAWLYRHPRYAHIPGTLLLDILPDPARATIYKIIRHYLLMVYLLVDLLFAYIALGIVGTGLGVESGLNPWMLLVLVGLLLWVVIGYNIWLVRIMRRAISTLPMVTPKA